MSGIIYKTTNLINHKWYIGKYQGSRPGYLGSGVALTRAIKKYGKENFKRDVLAVCEENEELKELEKIFIKETNAINDPMSYNIAVGGHGGHTWYPAVRSIEHCKKISDSLVGKKRPLHGEATKKQMSEKSRLRFAGRYEVTFVETGEKVVVECLSEFAKNHNITGKTLRYSAKNGVMVKEKYLVTRLVK